jgi:uncharacterized paraquat-inducible protein A
MLQIKTIKNRLDNASAFDEAVNAALAEGWRLTKRDVICAHAHPTGVTLHTMLYAEMEREEITEAECCCENCKYYEQSASTEPCLSCGENADKWESAT